MPVILMYTIARRTCTSSVSMAIDFIMQRTEPGIRDVGVVLVIGLRPTMDQRLSAPRYPLQQRQYLSRPSLRHLLPSTHLQYQLLQVSLSRSTGNAEDRDIPERE